MTEFTIREGEPEEYLRITFDNKVLISRAGGLVDTGLKYDGPLPVGTDGCAVMLRFLCKHWPIPPEADDIIEKCARALDQYAGDLDAQGLSLRAVQMDEAAAKVRALKRIEPQVDR